MTKTALWPDKYERDELLSVSMLVAFWTFVACLMGRAAGAW